MGSPTNHSKHVLNQSNVHILSPFAKWGFPKIGVPQIIQNQTTLVLKPMVLGYPYFRTHPNVCFVFPWKFPGIWLSRWISIRRYSGNLLYLIVAVSVKKNTTYNRGAASSLEKTSWSLVGWSSSMFRIITYNYPLVMTNIAMENVPFYRWFTWVYLLKMVIFHGYVK